MSPQIQEFTGTVKAVADYDSKDHYGICIDEEWYNGKDNLPIHLEEGDEVKMAVNDSEDFIDIEAVKKIQDGKQDNNRSEKTSSKNGGGPAQSPTLTKDQQIRKSLAFKKACDKVPWQKAFNDDGDAEDYKCRVKELMQVHEEILEEEMQ